MYRFDIFSSKQNFAMFNVSCIMWKEILPILGQDKFVIEFSHLEYYK